MSGQGTKDKGKKKTEDTVAAFGDWLGWGFMLLLVVSTAIHAVTLVMARTNTSLTSGAGSLFQILGIVVVEGLALSTAIKFMTHRIRSEQKPAGIALELTWLGFAALNLISSFAVQANDTLALADVWVTYGLPISGLVVAAEYYMIHRLDPQAARKEHIAELLETIAETQHTAKTDVLESEAFKAAMFQAAWQTVPREVGRDMHLNEEQIQNIIAHAPKLLTASDTAGDTEPQQQATDTAGDTSTRPDVKKKKARARRMKSLRRKPVALNGHAGNGNPTNRPHGR